MSAVEADRCQVSRLLCGLQWLHHFCLRAQHDDMGEPGTLSWTWAESLPRAARRGFGRRTTACWALSSLPGRPTSSSFTVAALGPARACGEAWNRAVNYSREWGPYDWRVLSPTAIHWDGSSSHYTLDLLLGAHVELVGEHVCGGSTPGHWWVAERERGPHDRSVLSPTGSSPGQTTSWNVATSTVTHVDVIEAASMPEPYWLWCGSIELYVGAQE
jgi:hypothetical protein